jgi:hypothetical protein
MMGVHAIDRSLVIYDIADYVLCQMPGTPSLPSYSRDKTLDYIFYRKYTLGMFNNDVCYCIRKGFITCLSKLIVTS